MKYSIGFIGGGRVTRILLQGFKNKNVSFGKVVVADTNPDALSKLIQQFPNVESVETKTAAGQDSGYSLYFTPSTCYHGYSRID